MPRCGCTGTCSCVIEGGQGVTVEGVGSLDNPYTISTESASLIQTLAFDDTATVDFTTTGAGTVGSPIRVSATARLKMTELNDVVDNAPVTGDVPVWVSDHWEFQPPPVAPAGSVNVSKGITGAGTVGSPLALKTPLDWGVTVDGRPDLDSYGSDSTIGQPVYVDSAGNVRTQPLVLGTALSASAVPSSYPVGVSVMALSAAGTWPGTGMVVTHRRFGDTDATSVASQHWYQSGSTRRVLYRVGDTTWSEWREVLLGSATIPGSTNLNTYIVPGDYIQPSAANAASGSNYPVPYAGLLEVGAQNVATAGGLVWQRYTVAAGAAGGAAGTVYQRQYGSGSWTSWTSAGASDTGWIDGGSGSSIFVVDSSRASLTGSRVRKVGRVVSLWLEFTLKAAIDNPSNGNIGNTSFGQLAAAYRPDQSSPYPSGLEQGLGSANTGRFVNWTVTATGYLKACSTGSPNNDLYVGEDLSAAGTFLV